MEALQRISLTSKGKSINVDMVRLIYYDGYVEGKKDAEETYSKLRRVKGK